MSQNGQTFLRDYQEDAVDDVVMVFTELDPRRRAKGEEIPLKKRVTIVVSPTASGKTMIMKSISDRLSVLGYSTLVLTHLATVANQSREAGLTTATVHNLFHAFKAAAAEKLRGQSARRFVSARLSLPETFFEQELLIIVDESHWGAENLTRIYQEVISLTRARMITGFTATPRWQGVFHTIDLTDKVKMHIAPPRVSMVYTQSLLTLPFQLTIYPAPGLIFTQSVAAAALLSMVTNLISGRRESILIVGNARSSLESYVKRMFGKDGGQSASLGRPKKKAATNAEADKGEASESAVRSGIVGDDDGGDGEGRLNTAPEAGGAGRHGDHGDHGDTDSVSSGLHVLSFRTRLDSPPPRVVVVDRAERRLGMVAILLVLDRLSRLSRDEALRNFGNILDYVNGVPRVFESIRLVDSYRPELSEALRKSIFQKDAHSIEVLAAAVREINMEASSDSNVLASGGYSWGCSVYKIGTGFNLPELRTICMAESVTDSRVLYKQRAGRGARKLPGKPFYDLIDVVYLDPQSDAGAGETRIGWMNTLIDDPEVRSRLEDQDLIFREVCGEDVQY